MTEQPNKTELNRSAKILGIVFSISGWLTMLVSHNLPAYFGSFGFVVGLGVAILGIIILAKGAKLGEQYLERKKVLASLDEDKRGIVWVWVVALSTWAIMAIAYFSLSVVVYMVLDKVEAFYPWSGDELGVLTLTRNVMGWFLIIMTIGIIGWALINSARREDGTYPTY